jgi:hypothetical protein
MTVLTRCRPAKKPWVSLTIARDAFPGSHGFFAFCRRKLRHCLPVPPNAPRTIKVLTHQNPFACIAEVISTGWDVDNQPTRGHGIILAEGGFAGKVDQMLDLLG